MDTEALRQSWKLLEQLGDEAAEVFYAVLFTAAPEVRDMFPVSMTAQRDKLLKALGHIVARVDNPELLTSFAGQLGRDHRRFGVLAQHYQPVGRALMETLRRGLGAAWTTDLAADWAAAYQIVADIMVDAATKSAASTPAWWPADVLSVQRRCADIAVVTIRPHYPYSYIPGQSISVQTELRPRIWRYLSPANAPRADGTIELHVKAIPGGQVSPALTYELRPGHHLRLGAPVGDALTSYRKHDGDLLLIGGGTGLAPLRAIVEWIAQDVPTIRSTIHRRVTLVFGATRRHCLYDLGALRMLEEVHPWLTVVPAVEDDPTWLAGVHGRAVDAALQYQPWSYSEIYLAGSPDMVADSQAALLRAGCAADRLRVENFTNYIYPPTAFAARFAPR